jgi:hypothetical protein
VTEVTSYVELHFNNISPFVIRPVIFAYLLPLKPSFRYTLQLCVTVPLLVFEIIYCKGAELNATLQ